jgi:parallel beta-helix repeat protein
MEDPYIIENIVIDGQNSGSCITIRNSHVFFIIRNCTLYNSGWSWSNWDSGIKLINTRNGKLLNNNCSYNNGNGILEICGNNNNFSKNTVNYNSHHGISSWRSDYNNFLENEIKLNEINGIYFWFSDLNKIDKNAIDYNQNGISFIFSNINSITSNFIVGNNVSIYQFMSRGNIFIDNKFEYELPPPILPEIILEESDEDNKNDEKDQSETQDQLLITLAIVGTSVGTISGVAIGYLIHKRKVMKYITTSQIKPFKDKLETATITTPEEPIKLTPEIGLLPKNAIVKFKDLKKSAQNNKLKSKESGVNKKNS